MAGVITTGSFPKLLWPGVREVWTSTTNKWETKWTDLFDQEVSDKAYEEEVLSIGLGLPGRKSEGRAVEYDYMVQGYTTRYTNVVYAIGYIVTYEEIQDNLYPKAIKYRTEELNFVMQQAREVVGAGVYNNGFSTSFPIGDGAALFSLAHPTVAGNQANKPTVDVDLSEAALEDLIVQIMNTLNSRGNRIYPQPQSLHVSPTEWFNANRILKSVYQSDTANNAINVLKAENALPMGIKVNPFFTSPRAWFVRTNAPNGAKWFNRAPLDITQDNDFDTENLKVKAMMRFSCGVTNWRGVFGVNGP